MNGLLVSSNGQYAVCGDETSQPFSLLVWDLKARKLIYDFRMAGHKFLTRLADISKDGRFLACAVQELEDLRAPNLLICYDLSSGQVTNYSLLLPSFFLLLHEDPSYSNYKFISATYYGEEWGTLNHWEYFPCYNL